MTPTGLEQEDVSTNPTSILGNLASSGAAESGAVLADSASWDPELQELIRAWPVLPARVRTTLLDLARAALVPGRDHP
jgi:hypothetical protein